jgi:hypothetical protein
VSLGARRQARARRRRISVSGANRHQQGAVAELQARRQKETGGLQASHLAAIACVCCVQAERALAAVVRRAGSDVRESTVRCAVKGKLGPR